MDKKTTLNDILGNYQNLEMELIENEGELTKDIEKKLFVNNLEISDKMNGYERFTRYLKHQTEYLKSMEEHYCNRRKVIENAILKCKHSMINAMKITGNANLKTDEFNFTISKSKKWVLKETKINQDIKDMLISKGLAENNFKLHINEIKTKYKNKELPDWVEIIENEFLRVN